MAEMKSNTEVVFEDTCIESLLVAVKDGGVAKLVCILNKLMAELKLLPCKSSTGSGEFGSGASTTGQTSKDWQPLGIQVAHTLLSLCIYPQSTVNLSGDGELHAGNLAQVIQLSIPQFATTSPGPANDISPHSILKVDSGNESPLESLANSKSKSKKTPTRRRVKLRDSVIANNLEASLTMTEKEDAIMEMQVPQENLADVEEEFRNTIASSGSVFARFRKNSRFSEADGRNTVGGSIRTFRKEMFRRVSKKENDECSSQVSESSITQLNDSTRFSGRTSLLGRRQANKMESTSFDDTDHAHDFEKSYASGTTLPGAASASSAEMWTSPLETLISGNSYHWESIHANREEHDKNSSWPRGTNSISGDSSKHDKDSSWPRGRNSNSNSRDTSKHDVDSSWHQRPSSNYRGSLTLSQEAAVRVEANLDGRGSQDSLARTGRKLFGSSQRRLSIEQDSKRFAKFYEAMIMKNNILKLAEQLNIEAEEKARIAERPPRWFMLHPTASSHMLWDMLMALCLAYVLLFMPVHICFQPKVFSFPNWAWWVQTLVDLIFVLDIYVNCVTGVYIKKPNQAEEENMPVPLKGAPTTHPKKRARKRSVIDVMNKAPTENSGKADIVFKGETELSYQVKDIWTNYVQGWFFLDLMSVLPWSLLLSLFSDSISVGSAPKLLKLFRLARLIKLLKLFRLRKLLDLMQRNFSPTALELIKMALGISILSHYVACGFYFIAVMTNETGDGTWVEYYLRKENSIEATSHYQLYLDSIYWGFTTVTSVGYGDIIPVTGSEKSYALLVMYCGVAMMSAITGKLTSVLARFNAEKSNMNSKMQSIRSYCKHRRLPFELASSVREYFEVRVAQKASYDEEQILKDMSPSLKAQVVCWIHKHVIQSVPFFKGCSELFLSAVLCCMEPILFAPADIIIQKGQREMSMYILTKGTAAVVNTKGKVIKELYMGTSVGEIGLFFGVRRTATICSISFCDTFKLEQSDFIAVQEMYPDMKQLINTQAETMFTVGICCYICGEAGHVCIQCPHGGTGSKTFGQSGIDAVLHSGKGSTVVENIGIHWLEKTRAHAQGEAMFVQETIQDLVTPSIQTPVNHRNSPIGKTRSILSLSRNQSKNLTDGVDSTDGENDDSYIDRTSADVRLRRTSVDVSLQTSAELLEV